MFHNVYVWMSFAVYAISNTIVRRQVIKSLENLSEGTCSDMSYYFLTSSISQLITVKFWAEFHRMVSFL